MDSYQRTNFSLYHGSPVLNLVRPSSIYSREYEFVPAIYCSEEVVVAKANSKSGHVYEINVSGLASGIVNPGRPAKDQHPYAMRRISRVCRNYNIAPDAGAPLYHWLYDVKSEIGADTLRAALLVVGIWAIVGPMEPSSRSGLCDRGDQYRIISDNHVLSCRPISRHGSG